MAATGISVQDERMIVTLIQAIGEIMKVAPADLAVIVTAAKFELENKPDSPGASP